MFEQPEPVTEEVLIPGYPFDELDKIAAHLLEVKELEQELADRKAALHQEFLSIMDELGLESYPTLNGTVSKYQVSRVKISSSDSVPVSLCKMTPDTKLVKKYLEENPDASIHGVEIETSSYVRFKPPAEEE